ncbi:bifunctional diguanylate cyclase/phosphodiesterase [Desulfogranum mediterraneum]|uniref:bifunctional diguanylate cyclase/phosphodiesterase n=1 Tax=Desulfogranum mediterraneum TaxID=160661 RepID=UPI001ABFA1A4|nr:EAL domain-containing protein [Desulfogranum mediterraneum]
MLERMGILIDENATQMVDLYSKTIGDWVQERKQEMRTHANVPAVISMNWEETEPYLRQEIAKRDSYYLIFFVADRDGNYNTTLLRNAGNISDRDYFPRVMAGETIVSEPVFSRSTGKQIIVIAAPIRDRQNQVVGLMGASLDLIMLYDWIKAFKVSHPNSYSYIIDRDGLVLTHPDRNMIMKANLQGKEYNLSSETVERLLRDGQGSVEYSFRNVLSRAYFREIPGTGGWKIITKIPEDYLFRPMYELSRSLLLLSLAGVVIIILFSVWLSAQLSRPIINLNKIFNRGADGDLTVIAEIESADEIGQASQSFNTMMETIGRMTYYDPLTHLPNMAFLLDRIKLELGHLRDERRMAVITIDIDRFRPLCDLFGKKVTNQILKVVSSRIMDTVPEGSVISRIGEDVFAVVLLKIHAEASALKITKKCLKRINQPTILLDKTYHISASAGLAFYPQDGKDEQQLLKSANMALDRVKLTAGSTVQVFDSSMGLQLSEQHRLINDLNGSITNGELEIHYQPFIEIGSGKIIGKEALLRWRHPELGLVLPGRFINMAEDSGMIFVLGKWVLRQVCLQHKAWLDMGNEPGYVAVNVSPREFAHPDFEETVTTILEQTCLPPQFLELEITETIAMEDAESTLKVINSLKERGIRLSIDDFGTGYSSLTYLERFNADVLKIDKFFINGVPDDQKLTSIVRTIISMAHHLGLKVLAEGVETATQRTFLHRYGCDYAQGFYYARPLPAAEIEQILTGSRPLVPGEDVGEVRG